MVTKKPKGLGLGLEALLGPRVKEIGDAATKAEGLPNVLKLTQLQPGKYQPRTRMDEGSLYELAESIKAQGVMQPILVRPVGEFDRQSADDRSRTSSLGTSPSNGTLQRYEIIAGERRVRAARLAGLQEVPVLVREVPDQAAAAPGGRCRHWPLRQSWHNRRWSGGRPSGL